MPPDFDIAVVGSGFGGSLIAMIARQLGRSVILIERGRHPRFAIGESSTPLANLLLEELAREYHLDSLLPLTKWGTWQDTHPEIACGLKRGFTFYHHELDQPWKCDPRRRHNELLVAASPHDRIADTHWYRADVDHFFVQQAQAIGVEFIDETELHSIKFDSDAVHLSGPSFAVTAGFVIDATGPRGFLHRALNLAERPFENFPVTQALYSHFENVALWENLPCYTGGFPPYAVDDAAMHHIFPGGWIWVLRFNNGITSAGVATTEAVDDPNAWPRLLARLPSVEQQFEAARPVCPMFHLPQVSFRTAQAVGDRWAMLPSAVGSIDPLLSTGFPLTLWGISRLAKIIQRDCEPAALKAYEEITFAELERSARLVTRLYASFDNFEEFCARSMIYFAAASYSEAARRLGRPEKAPSFLFADGKSIDAINIAGLADPARRNWYPALADDLLQNCWKLGVSREEVEQMLQRIGF
jgi:tetracycline 7-halogenase / FADH2 O2-dependent halogenase